MLSDYRAVAEYFSTPYGKKLLGVLVSFLCVIVGVPFAIYEISARVKRGKIDGPSTNLILQHPDASAAISGIIVVTIVVLMEPGLAGVGCVLAGIFAGSIIGAAKAHAWPSIFALYPEAFACFAPSIALGLFLGQLTSTGGGDQRGMVIVVLPYILLGLSPFPLLGTFCGWFAVGRHRAKSE
jgi:hypothetical protein